ncbi:degT [Symbiodinium natans]|uniref:DegT protein n=1 Tax=Symbiodinium natans TaxID=878477 RepID=A0A812T905_9DINO|nr:degT [Symbiodinium natans]
MSIKAETGGIPLDSSFQDTLNALAESTNPDAILHGLRLVASQGEFLGNQQGLAEVVARHLASSKPEVIAMAVRALGVLGEAGGHYADHVAAVMRWPNPDVRLAAVEAPLTVDVRKCFQIHVKESELDVKSFQKIRGAHGRPP